MGSVPALAGILLVVLTVVNLILVQDSFLNYTNEKYSVHKTLSMSEDDLEKVVHSMISYVKGKSDSPQIAVEIHGKEMDFFNIKEVGHLEDVRVLVTGGIGKLIVPYCNEKMELEENLLLKGLWYIYMGER